MSELETGDLDGEGWGKWDGVPLPAWLRRKLAPYTSQIRERRLQELLDALSPPSGVTDSEEGRSQREKVLAALQYGFGLYGYDGPDGPWPIDKRHEFDRLARIALGLPDRPTTERPDLALDGQL